MKNESSLNWSLEYPKDDDLQWVDITDSKNKKIIYWALQFIIDPSYSLSFL